MRKAFRKNWIPKIVSLVLATAIWLLIKQYLVDQEKWDNGRPDTPPKARELSPEELRALETGK